MRYLLSQLVDQAAERDPQRDAFRMPGVGLTYGELAQRSNQLAHLLIQEGIGRGDRVGIFLPRVLETAVAVYGIQKAGAAFVPIDPHMPLGGLRQILQGCGIRHLVASESQRSMLERLAQEETPLRSVIGLDGEIGGSLPTLPWSSLEAFPGGHGPDLRLLEDDLAYLMYSSGSTGSPKGIMHTHHSGMSYARLSVHTYDVGPEDRIGNHSPLHFDMSTFGYFSAPLAGATTVLIPEAYTKLTASLSQLMEAEKLTIWYSVPLALIQLLSRGVLESRNLRSLRWVLFGGEPFPRKHLRDLMERWPDARFSNVYGPAEVNQCTFYHVPPKVPDLEEDPSEPIPIGHIWANTEAIVIDETTGQVVEKEGQGELLVRSATMMRGYWERPDLDAACFHRILTPYGERTFYRTGDLVHRKEDGEMLFLGRLDRQLKIRGYRVELDEIERTLTSHGAVSESAVVPVRRQEEVQGLEASVRLQADAEASPQDLRTFLKNLLSWYAVPSSIHLVEDFPRTTSGKIDRRRLQELAEDGER